MAITYFGSASSPADNGTSTATQITLTPPSNMKVGDLVYVHVQRRASATFSIGVTGGQSWQKEVQEDDGTRAYAIFWCRFNGTWAANPRFDISGGTCTSAVMHVFRPSDTSKYWAVDYEAIRGTFTGGISPFTRTINSYTTTKASTLAIAMWCTAIANTWGTLAGTGWDKTGMTAQYRNTSGSDQSSTFAYRIQSSIGATNNVSQNASTNAAGMTCLLVFYERDSDFMGYPTIGNSSSPFTSGDAVATKRIAHRSARGAVAEFWVQSTSGTNSLYGSLYRRNGLNFDLVTSVGPKTFDNTGGFYRVLMPCNITSGDEYYLLMYTTGAADFKYAFYSGVYDSWAWVFNVGSFGSAPTWPSSISDSAVSYFDSNCSVTLQFTNELFGITVDVNSLLASIRSVGKLKGIATDVNGLLASMRSVGKMLTSGYGMPYGIGNLADVGSPSGAEFYGLSYSGSFSYGNMIVRNNLQGRAIAAPSESASLKSVMKMLAFTIGSSHGQSSILLKMMAVGKSIDIVTESATMISRIKMAGFTVSDITGVASMISRLKMSGHSSSIQIVSANMIQRLALSGRVHLVNKALMNGAVIIEAGVMKKYINGVWVLYRLRNYNGIDVDGCPVRIYNNDTDQWDTVTQL